LRLFGSWGAEFYEGIKPLPGEIVIDKHHYSAFIETDLDLILRSKGIRTLIMSGVQTDVCVESTARYGFMKDYYLVFLKDCTSTTSEEIHNNTLRSIAMYFGEVVDSRDVIKCWEERKASTKAYVTTKVSACSIYRIIVQFVQFIIDLIVY